MAEDQVTALQVNLKNINELSKQTRVLMLAAQDQYPRDPLLWNKVKEASVKRFDKGKYYDQVLGTYNRKNGLFGFTDEELYTNLMQGTFDERVALMLMQVLEIAAEYEVDLEWIIPMIEYRRLKGKTL